MYKTIGPYPHCKMISTSSAISESRMIPVHILENFQRCTNSLLQQEISLMPCTHCSSFEHV
uniref:Uncharacterized protein n=1 Tax=Rhizophora mucronata TaxID=61149 RepID=A0A2P2P3W5_RHIMU